MGEHIATESDVEVIILVCYNVFAVIVMCQYIK